MSNIVELKNSLRIRKHILYNKLSNTIMSKHPFNCSKCGKGCYIQLCVTCINADNMIERSILAEHNGIIVDKTKTFEEQNEEIKSKEKIILSNNNIMNIADVIKIKLKHPNLGKHSKEPIDNWLEKQNQNSNYKANSEYNIGIVCNKISGVFGVDLDFYSKIDKDGNIDEYDPINNKKHKQFIDLFGKDYIETFDTFTQKTANGGIHLLFRHEEGLIQLQSKGYKIDTRGGNTNGYLVGFNSIVNGKKYEVILHKDIKPLPKKLKDFLLNIVAKDCGVEIKQPKNNKKIDKLIKSVKHFDIDQQHKFNLTDADIRKICDNLPDKYFLQFEYWMKFTSGMKQIGKKDIWREYSKKWFMTFDAKENEEYWNKFKNNNVQCLYFEHLVVNSGFKDLINLTKYKPLPDKKSKPDTIINMEYLTGEYIIDEHKPFSERKEYSYLLTDYVEKLNFLINGVKRYEMSDLKFLYNFDDVRSKLEVFLPKQKQYDTYKYILKLLKNKRYEDDKDRTEAIVKYETFKYNNNRYINGFDYDDYDDIILQSDTGTAKSSSFKQYMIKTGQKFVSIVSRISLAQEQHADFEKEIEGVDIYTNEIDNTNNGLIICIDSIMKIKRWSYSHEGKEIELKNRVVFLDEFNSLIEYCLESSTMNNKRIEVFEFLVNDIFLKAKKIICSDADISDISIKFIEYIKELRKKTIHSEAVDNSKSSYNPDKFIEEYKKSKTKRFTYIQNKHIHNKGTPATQIVSKRELIKQLNKEKTFICATDSRNEAKDIYEQLIKLNPTEEIKLIVARQDIRKGSETHIDLKSHAKIIFSPKIVYGNDSNGYLGIHKRPVYCYYTEQTISPTAMLQQINRERKISHLYYCFAKQQSIHSKITSSKQVLNEIETTQLTALNTILETPTYSDDLLKMFIDLTVDLRIKKDAYNTNKFVHFKVLLPQRGFNDTRNGINKTWNQSKKDKIDKAVRVSQFNTKNFKVEDAILSQINIDVLKMSDKELIKKNQNLFINNGAIQQYIMRNCFYLKNKEYCKILLSNENEFAFKKYKNSKYFKVMKLYELYNILGYNKDLTPNDDYREFTDEETKKIYKHFIYFNTETQLQKINDKYKRLQGLVKITKKLLGKDLIDSTKKRLPKEEGGKTIQEYKLNDDIQINLVAIQVDRNKTEEEEPDE